MNFMSRQSQFCKNLIKGCEGRRGLSAVNCPVITFISHLVVSCLPLPPPAILYNFYPWQTGTAHSDLGNNTSHLSPELQNLLLQHTTTTYNTIIIQFYKILYFWSDDFEIKPFVDYGKSLLNISRWADDKFVQAGFIIWCISLKIYTNYKATSNFPTVTESRNANKKMASTERPRTWSNRAIEHRQTANKPFLAAARQVFRLGFRLEIQ